VCACVIVRVWAWSKRAYRREVRTTRMVFQRVCNSVVLSIVHPCQVFSSHHVTTNLDPLGSRAIVDVFVAEPDAAMS